MFNRIVGVGKATFGGLYSSPLHLDFTVALPSTSSDHCIYLRRAEMHTSKEGLLGKENKKKVCLCASHGVT